MRIPTLVALLLLCVLSNWVLQPCINQGWSTVDLPILYIMYLSQLDRKNRLYILAGVLTIIRAGLGVESIPSAFFPILIAIESQVLARRWLQVRDPVFRLVILAPCFGLVVAAKIAAASLQDFQQILENGIIWQEALKGALWGGMGALLLYPILDCFRPHLRSYRYPL